MNYPEIPDGWHRLLRRLKRRRANELIGTNPAAIKPALDKLFAGEWKKGAIPELWDGQTADRIIAILSALEI